MPYENVLVGFTKKTLIQLIDGESVSVKRSELKPIYPFPLPKGVIMRLSKFATKDSDPKGEITLKLSKANIKHFVDKYVELETLDGSGFWSKFKNAFKKVYSKVLKPAYNKVLKPAGKALLPALKAVAPVLIAATPGANEVINVGRETGKALGVGDQVNEGLKQTLGVGMRKKRGILTRKMDVMQF